jgi:chromate transporter
MTNPEPSSQPGPADQVAAATPAPDVRSVPWREFLGYFLGLGTWGFGGPIATVGYMQRDLVDRREWLTRKDFLDGVALGQSTPGPLAAQVVMWLGFLRAGTLGALATSAAFIGPSFVFVFAVAIVYAHYQGLRVVQALFFGIAPAVMAIIAIAAWRLAKLTNNRDWRLWTLSVILAVVTATTGSEIAVLVIAAGLLMIVLDARPRWLRRRPPDHAAVPALLPLSAKTLAGKTLTAKTLAVGAATGGTLAALGWFFLKAGALIFGSGLAIVPFLRQGVVYQHHWLTNTQFLDAVAIGLITPGPVVITATFIGYLTAGWQGAIVATLAIFAPIYVAVVLVGRWLIRHRDNHQIKAFVAGATAAAAGAITGAVVVLSRQTIHQWTGAAIAVIALAVLLKWKVKEPIVVAAGAAAGLALHWPW